MDKCKRERQDQNMATKSGLERSATWFDTGRKGSPRTTHLIKSDFCINVHCQNTEASSSNSVNNTFIIIDMTMYNGACRQEEEWDRIPRTSTVRWNVQKVVQSNVNEAWQWANSQVTNSQQVFHLPDTHRVCTLWVCRVKGHGYVLSARSFKISSCKAHAATEGKDWLATVEFT